ncbi:hypothetical protein CK203_097411 [Vitis vinifera]|uniref:Uncharacterized protein n=1 Tax=Vitis vinifera TaxID=29760 RepID=A0A438D9C7_VITVI|nr:hypothetical protein CK203_097411 [Vitis vinifera]
MQERSNEDLYNPIDMNHIFIDDDILDEWIRGDEPILSSDNLDWLDKGLPTNEEDRERDVDSVVKIRLLEQFLQVLVVMMVTMGAVGGVVALVGAIEELVALVKVLEEMRDIQILEHELVTHMDMINLLVAVALLIEVLDTINMVLIPNSLRNHIFLIMDHQANHLTQHIQVMNNSFNHILTMGIATLICRRTDDDDFEPPRHSTWN